MTASVEPVVMDQVVRVCAFGPAARGLIELVREDADRERDRDRLGVEEIGLVLPVEASRRDACVREPVQRQVVENVIARQGTVRAARITLPSSPGCPVPSP